MRVSARADALAAVVGAVARQALHDWGATRVALLDDGSPEAELAGAWLAAALPAGALLRLSEPLPELESLLQAAGVAAESARAEALRVSARAVDGALVANPVNKTALLLGGPLPPEPFLPLGDLYASEIRAVTGGWSAPESVRGVVELAGGLEALDAALGAHLERRDPAGLAALPAEAREEVERALARGRASRTLGRLVPKIGYRTIGLDLFQ